MGVACGKIVHNQCIVQPLTYTLDDYCDADINPKIQNKL